MLNATEAITAKLRRIVLVIALMYRRPIWSQQSGPLRPAMATRVFEEVVELEIVDTVFEVAECW